MAKFRASARTVDMLGQEQIAGVPTAISELFKNAHDAYETTVEVDFFRTDGLFVLRDDGVGMTVVSVRVIPQPNVQVIHHWAPRILSTPSHPPAPAGADR